MTRMQLVDFWFNDVLFFAWIAGIIFYISFSILWKMGWIKITFKHTKEYDNENDKQIP